VICIGGLVLALMPHPENLIDPLVGGTDGRGIFEGLVGFRRVA
jgi:phosphoribosylformylglycinamidine (FGAM) synthase-like amidotransferase family enzyme